jgi:thiamine transport system permease protein
MPAIASAALLIFIFDFTSFGVILVLGGPRFATLEVEIYHQTIGLFNLPLAAALSIIQLVFTLGLFVLYSRLSARLSRPLSLRPVRVTEQRLRSKRSRLLAGLYLAALFALLTLPLLALITRSFVSLSAPRSAAQEIEIQPTLTFYQELGINRQESYFYAPPTTAIAISLAYGLITVLLALGLGLPASWALTRDKNAAHNRLLEPLLMLPLGTSWPGFYRCTGYTSFRPARLSRPGAARPHPGRLPVRRAQSGSFSQQYQAAPAPVRRGDGRLPGAGPAPD